MRWRAVSATSSVVASAVPGGSSISTLLWMPSVGGMKVTFSSGSSASEPMKMPSAITSVRLRCLSARPTQRRYHCMSFESPLCSGIGLSI